MHGDAHRSSFALALVKKSQARRQEREDGGRPVDIWLEGRCCAWLVVVLEEAREGILKIEPRVQVLSYRTRVTLAQAVVQALVVRVVEALLLEHPLEVPVHLGHEDEPGMPVAHGRNCARPEGLGVHAPRA